MNAPTEPYVAPPSEERIAALCRCGAPVEDHHAKTAQCEEWPVSWSGDGPCRGIHDHEAMVAPPSEERELVAPEDRERTLASLTPADRKRAYALYKEVDAAIRSASEEREPECEGCHHPRHRGSSCAVEGCVVYPDGPCRREALLVPTPARAEGEGEDGVPPVDADNLAARLTMLAEIVDEPAEEQDLLAAAAAIRELARLRAEVDSLERKLTQTLAAIQIVAEGGTVDNPPDSRAFDAVVAMRARVR